MLTLETHEQQQHPRLIEPPTRLPLIPFAAMLSRQALRTFRAAAPAVRAPVAVRTYAAASAQETVKPPVSLFGLDGTYATALVQ